MMLIKDMLHALNQFVTQLRDPHSNVRWLLRKSVRVTGHILHAVQHPKAPEIALSGLDTGTNTDARIALHHHVAFMAWTVLLMSVALISSALTVITLVISTGPDALAAHHFKHLAMLLPAAGLLGCSIGRCMSNIRVHRQSLQRYWPELNVLRKLQTIGIFSALYLLAISPNILRYISE